MNTRIKYLIGMGVIVALVTGTARVYAEEQTPAPKAASPMKEEKKAEKSAIQAMVTGTNEACTTCPVEAGKPQHNVLRVSSAQDADTKEIAELKGKILHYTDNAEGKKLAAGQADQILTVIGMVSVEEGKIAISQIGKPKTEESAGAASAPSPIPSPSPRAAASARVAEKKDEKKDEKKE
ncbi:MAG: hypothetical protein HY706_17485 [Candidatus Hydrogenedentes bacterium]|nr:hypothetical protein [Candidatus Hydrogenedentota bacterium]